jgi:hypothetical protein
MAEVITACEARGFRKSRGYRANSLNGILRQMARESEDRRVILLRADDSVRIYSFNDGKISRRSYAPNHPVTVLVWNRRMAT